MNNPIQDRVLAATKSCLRPLARILLRAGINYRQFSEIAKHAFLEEAISERDHRGRQPNLSRVAVRTGISRKEVARIRDRVIAGQSAGRGQGAAPSRSGLAARVLQLWHSESNYVDPSGRPKELAFAGDEGSFSSLVRLAGGDVPPGAVRAELIAANAAIESPTGHLSATKRFFLPGDVGEDVVVGLAHIVHPLVEGVARNTGPDKSDPYFQRLAYSDRLLPAALPLFREVAHVRCTEFVQSVDDWLSGNEIGPQEVVPESTRVGVGVFYFEGATPSV